MSYLALYRKYRPTSFDDFVGQSDVANVIKNEIINNRISHAYLFSGPRGTGKTSTAKIIARMINCSCLGANGVPCGKCDSCLNINNSDIVEIDAASNNGVDEIRELRDKVNLVPTFGKYKVYIIDEVHMLTTQAFNALLKTLEEPPAHAIFILATTEFYKIPATVVSRCQKFQFLKFTNDEIVGRLSKICKLENVSVSDSILFEIARLSDGGLRDAINMLDQLLSFKSDSFEISDVYKLNGVVSYDEIANLLIFILRNDVKEIVFFVENLNKIGINLDKFVVDFVDFLKDLLIYKSTSSFYSNNSFKNEGIKKVSDLISEDVVFDFIIEFNDILNKMKNSGFSLILLITNLIKLSNLFSNKDKKVSEAVVINSNDEKKSVNDMKINNDDLVLVNKVSFDPNLKKIRINNSFSTASKVKKESFVLKWDELKNSLNGVKYSSLIGIIDDIDVMVVGDNNVIFCVKYDSLLDRIYDYLIDLENLLFDFYGNSYKVVFLDNDEWNYEKNKYISSLKDGKKYTYIVENVEKNVNNDYTNNDVDKLVSLIGNDVITYK